MEDFIADIPHDALQVAFFQLGSSSRFSRGWVHEKTVPYGIVAQSLSGQYEVTCAGRTVRLRASEAFLTPAYEPLRIVHHHDARNGFSARWMHFSFVLYQTIDLTTLLEMPLRIEASTAKKFGGIMEELSKPFPSGISRSLTNMVRRRELMWSVLRILCALSKLKAGALDRLKAGRRLAPLLTHLKTNLAQPITVSEMAELTCMSTSAFFNFFRSRMDCSPMEYLKRMRLNEAATRFSSGERLLKEVAGETGFATPFHLSREFKKRFGLSPKEYRRLQSPSNSLHDRALIT